MANRMRRLVTGGLIGALPGVALFLIGALFYAGTEAALSFGAIGILLAIAGIPVGAFVAAQTRGEPRVTRPTVIGALLGTVPGVALIFVYTRLAFPVILIGGLVGAFIGSRSGHGGSRRSPVH